MGQGASSSADECPPSDIRKLNDSMYELYCPDKCVPNVEIYFFHGLQTTELRDAYWKTWISETDSGGILWPKEWLPPKFPQARIVSVSYDACAFMTPTAGRQDLFTIGETLVADLVQLVVTGQDRPIVLVGHSLGGLVIKQVVLEANKQANAMPDNCSRQRRLSSFLNSIKGIFYFSTPHHGSQLVDLASGMPSGWKGLSQVMQKISGIESDRLNEAFRIWRKNRKNEIQAFSIGETHETLSRKGSFRRQSSFVVPESSARYDTDGYLSVPGDHFQVAKPKSPVASSFQALTRFISAVSGVAESTFEMDSHKIATGLPVEKPEGFNTRAGRPTGSEPVEGVPVKTHERDPGKGLYVKIDVPEDRRTFFEQFADKWQDDVVNNYGRDSSEVTRGKATWDGLWRGNDGAR